MAKNRIRRGRKQHRNTRQPKRVSTRAITVSSVSTREKLLSSRQLILALVDWSLTIAVAAAAIIVKENHNLQLQIVQKTPGPVLETASFALGLVTILSFFRIFARNNDRFIADHEYAIRYLRISIILDGIRIALCVLLLLYGLGAVDTIAHALTKLTNFLSERASYILSTLLTWLVSGVIGNAAYDGLKHLLMKPRKQK